MDVISDVSFDLHALCVSLHIPPSNCSCDKLNFIVGVGNELCDNTTTPEAKVRRDEKVIYSTSITLVADILGIIGNSLVIYILSKKDIGISRHTNLIKYLAICDLVFSCLSILKTTPGFYTEEWVYGVIGCKIIQSGIQLGALIAIGMILIISIERFVGIVFPMKRMSSFMTNSLIVVNIAFGIGAVIPIVLVLDLHKEDESCRESWTDITGSAIYSWSMMFIYFIVPITAITYLYLRIFRALKRNFTSRYRNTSVHTDKLYKRRVKENKKIMISLVAVHIAFIIFTFPSKLKWVIFDTTWAVTKVYPPPDLFFFISQALYPFHTAVNPLIYTVANERFRQLLVRTFRTFLRCGLPSSLRRTAAIRQG